MKPSKALEVEVITKETRNNLIQNNSQNNSSSNNRKYSNFSNKDNPKKPKSKNFFVNILKKVIPIAAVITVLVGSILIIKVFVDYRNSPNVKDQIASQFNQEGSIITDRNGEVIYDYKQDA